MEEGLRSIGPIRSIRTSFGDLGFVKDRRGKGILIGSLDKAKIPSHRNILDAAFAGGRVLSVIE